MRLIDCEVDGVFTLTADLGRGRVPEYAILSHTWGADDDEVKYNHLTNGDGGDRLGWEKIRFCAARARRDGLRYIWVDSCCIDKTSSAELTEAINSMFSWYKCAARCYVYLADVSVTDEQASGQREDGSEAWMSALFSSRWFTRCWTLQELLAPSVVEFFSLEGNLLGNRESLLKQIHTITRVSVAALSGDDLDGFGVSERFNWAEHRQATREEDCAYSLMGIFGVYMVPIYGEGKENATRRLKREINMSAQESKRERGKAIVHVDSSSESETSNVDLERIMMLLDESKIRAADSRSRLLESTRMSEANDTNIVYEISSFFTFLTTVMAGIAVSIAMFASPTVVLGMLDERLDRRITVGDKAMLSSQNITSKLRVEEDLNEEMMEKLNRARHRLEGEDRRRDVGLGGTQDDMNGANMEAERNQLQNERQGLMQSLEELRLTHEDLKKCLGELKALRSEEENKLSKLREEQEEIIRRRDEWENKTAWEKVKGWISWAFGRGS